MVFFLKEYEEFTEIAHFIKDALQQNRLFVLKKKTAFMHFSVKIQR